eukprot:12778020-Ditylum_brightwellii.AAC.1
MFGSDKLFEVTAATRGVATLAVACSRFYSYSLPLAEESRHSEFKYSPQASSRMVLDCLVTAVFIPSIQYIHYDPSRFQNLPKATLTSLRGG